MLAPPKEKGSRLRTPSPRLHRRKLSATCEVKERETRKQEWGEEVRFICEILFNQEIVLA